MDLESQWICPFCNRVIPMEENCAHCSGSLEMGEDEKSHGNSLYDESYMDGIESVGQSEDEYLEQLEELLVTKKSLTISWKALVAVVLILLFIVSLFE